MIKCDKGNIVINGSAVLALSELTTLVHAMHYDVFIGDVGMSPEESREKILEAIEKGFLTEEKIKQEVTESAGEVFAMLLDALKDIVQGKDVEK